MKIAGTRVLLVEDQPIIALALTDVLEDMGAIVVGPAASLNEALHIASSADFDAVLLDVNLRGVVSYPVGDVLRHRNIPFIVVTGGAATADEPAPFRTAPRLLKPVRDVELRTALEAI